MIDFPKHERGPLRDQFQDPVGQLTGSFRELMDHGCIQAADVRLYPIFEGLMILTNNNPCAGCPVWSNHGPECQAFQRYNTAFQARLKQQAEALEQATTPHNIPSGPLAGLSVRQIAQQLGVSISEVRRRKAAGTL